MRLEGIFNDGMCDCWNWEHPVRLNSKLATKYLSWTILFFGLFSAFYCDWVLAALERNYSGIPSSDIAILYWMYFVAKRLPMLSS